MKTTVLFPGSFNPVHHGHLAMAAYLAEQAAVDEVRLIVSPHNPLKGEASCPPGERLDAVKRRVSELPEAISSKITVSDVEFSLPEPRYTWNTLQALRAAEPCTRFILALGGDNILILEKWRRWQDILATTEVWVYPRPGYPSAGTRVRELAATTLPSAVMVRAGSRSVSGQTPVIRYLADAPQNDISSTRLREAAALRARNR